MPKVKSVEKQIYLSRPAPLLQEHSSAVSRFREYAKIITASLRCRSRSQKRLSVVYLNLHSEA